MSALFDISLCIVHYTNHCVFGLYFVSNMSYALDDIIIIEIG